ncbi:efflux RND transporter periplasmic adaptor subunit [Parabacteroides sp. PF5-9]|uniref:efflux RND transporter periplasmic adaptor subunit n=1 Tax=Parabacteroides sp. PF5-9 TaxID=1742404 RepID=UPI002476DDFF|nr:efflux RND transporter periplasmic adaptor subunit [Parabacteroides sp. PF5-9]MDH6356164.1 RND family efflux transporter MFP subunit [Parabacteroides sp. PF5-9]
MKQLWRLFGILILGVFLFSCSSRKEKENVVATIKIDTVKVYGQELSVTFPGKVKASADVNLAFRVGGTLLRVPVEAGTAVRKGQLLAEIDPRDYEIQLAATEAEYNRIKGEAERLISLYEKESVSPNDYEKALYGLQQITAKYHAHKNALADTRLLAPFDGYVQKRLFDAGETVSAGMPVVALINNTYPEVEVSLPISDYIRREEFDTYTCTSEIFPGVTFPLTLSGITRKANLNQLYTMRLVIKPIAGQTLPTPGMSVTVTLNYREKESMLTLIPLTALFGQGENGSVWVYNESSGTIAVRRVKAMHVQTNGMVVISEGLRPGEIVVTAGVHSLKEGQVVKPLPQVSSTNVGGLL